MRGDIDPTRSPVSSISQDHGHPLTRGNEPLRLDLPVAPTREGVADRLGEGDQTMTSARLDRAGRVHVFNLRVEQAGWAREFVAGPGLIDATHDLHVVLRHPLRSISRHP